MGSISTTTTSYARKATQSKTGTASGTTKAKAINAATTAANNATPNTMGSWSNNGTSSTKYLGINYGSKSTSVGVPYQSGSTWYCSWTASRVINHYQIKLAFTIPSELSAAAAVSSATLSIVTTGTLSTNNSFYVCAPASSSSTEPTAYTVNTASSIYSTKASFSGNGSANQTYTVTITNQLKQCITAGKGWLIITVQSEDSAGYNYRATVTSASISYNLTTYTITYKPGSNGTGSQTTSTKTYGVALTLKGETFTRSGYVQTGWSTSDGGSKTYNLSASYTSNAATTLYPYWTVCSIRLVNSSSLDTYRIYIVNSSSGLDTYRAYIVNGTSLDAYS